MGCVGWVKRSETQHSKLDTLLEISCIDARSINRLCHFAVYEQLRWRKLAMPTFRAIQVCSCVEPTFDLVLKPGLLDG
jgi:hypothetical protein